MTELKITVSEEAMITTGRTITAALTEQTMEIASKVMSSVFTGLLKETKEQITLVIMVTITEVLKGVLMKIMATSHSGNGK